MNTRIYEGHRPGHGDGRRLLWRLRRVDPRDTIPRWGSCRRSEPALTYMPAIAGALALDLHK